MFLLTAFLRPQATLLCHHAFEKRGEFMKRAVLAFCAIAGFAAQGFAANAQIGSCLAIDPYWKTDEALLLCSAASSQDFKLDGQKAKGVVFFRLGAAQYWSQNFELSLSSLNVALEADPDNMLALLRRGWANVMSGRRDAALADFSEMVAKDPRNVRGYFALHYLYATTGGNANSETALRQALKIDPSFHFARFKLVEIEYEKHPVAEKAIQELSDILDFGETELNRTEIAPWTNTLQTKSFYELVLNERAGKLLASDRNDEALVDTKEIARRFPNSTYAQSQLARAYLKLGQLIPQLEIAERAVDLCRGRPFERGCLDAHMTRLDALVELKRNKELFAAAQEASQQPLDNEDLSRTIFYAGLAQLRMGEVERAKPFIVQAAQMDPFVRGQVLTQLVQFGFYDGNTYDEYSDAISSGVDACVLDDMCMRI